MSPENQRIAIAEACGWRECRRGTLIGHKITDTVCGTNDRLKANADWWEKKTGERRFETDRVPDYLNDLNAMREAEKTLSRAQRTVYMSTIWECGFERNYRVPEWRRENGSYATHASFFLAHATAAQRAEAFLKVLGKWEETP